MPTVSLQRALSSVPSARSARRNTVRVFSTQIETPAALRIAPWTNAASEVEALETLTSKLKESPYAFDEDTVKWFLRDRSFDPVEAEEKLLKTAKWRQEMDLENLNTDQFTEEYALGKVRLHDHSDILGRPVILLDASKHFPGQFPVTSTKKLCAYAVREAIDRLPDGKDTFITIYDLRRFGTANADLQFIKYLIDLFFVYHPKRLGQSLLVDAPWVFQPVWQIVKPLLRKYASLVRFVKTSQVRDEYFTDQTVPPEFRE